MLEREALTIPGCEIQQEFHVGEMEGFCRPRHPFRAQEQTDLVTDTSIKLQEGTAAQMLGTFGEDMNCLVSGQVLEGISL